MRPPERLVFDFETNAWVLADAFNVRAQGREFVLAVPEGEPAPGRWSRPKTPPKKASATMIAMSVLIVMLVGASIVSGHSVFLMPALILMAVADHRRYIDRTSLVANNDDLRLFEDPEDPDVCLVALSISRDNEHVGTDRGVAWFADGCLLYTGHRTSFAIGGEDVLPRGEYGTTGVPLRVPRGTASISLSPLQRRSDIGGRQEMRFLKALYHFRKRPPQSRIPRQWPPFEP